MTGNDLKREIGMEKNFQCLYKCDLNVNLTLNCCVQFQNFVATKLYYQSVVPGNYQRNSDVYESSGLMKVEAELS